MPHLEQIETCQNKRCPKLRTGPSPYQRVVSTDIVLADWAITLLWRMRWAAFGSNCPICTKPMLRTIAP